MPPDTVDEVLAALDRVVERGLRDGSRLGYFAVLYRTVTAKVKEGIEEGFFDDAERMEHLDLIFAKRYLDAFDAFDRGQPLTRSWQDAFEAAAGWRPIVLQHLLVGINAHINLDLGVAAAECAPGDKLPGLRRDFDRINEILALVMAQVQRNLGKISPWIGLLDRIGGRTDDEVVRFSIVVARTEAWRFATELAPLPGDQWAAPIGARDTRVARLARLVLRPGPLSAGLLLIRARETNDVRKTIEMLAQVPGPALEAVEARVHDERAPGH